MIDSAYTKKKILSLIYSIIRNYFLVIVYGNIISTMIINVGWNNVFSKLPIKNITLVEYDVIKINDFLVISIVREILIVLLFVSIAILYRDNTTSIIKFTNIILIISGLCELAGLFFIIIKLVILVLISNYHTELYFILYTVTCFVNIFYIYIIMHTYFKLDEIRKRIMEASVLEINTI